MSVGEPYVKNQFAFLNPVADAGGFADHQASSAKSLTSLQSTAPVVANAQPAMNTNCPAGGQTTVCATLATVPLGDYSVLASGVCAILLGPTPPSALDIAVEFASGSQILVPPALLVANATLLIPLFGAESQPAATTVGLRLNVQPTGQAVTCLAAATFLSTLAVGGP